MIDLLRELMPIKQTGLFSILLGSSGSGKSYAIGTYPGKTLLLYGASEAHGVASAHKANKDLLPIAWDRVKDAMGGVVPVEPNKILKRLTDLLDPEPILKAGVKCVAIDSITSLMLDLKTSDQFKQACMSKHGNHDAFRETDVLTGLWSQIFRKLEALSERHDIDVITTIDIQLQEVGSEGEILEAKPYLPTYGVAKAIVQSFPDVMVIGRIGDKRTPMLQNLASVGSTSFERQAPGEQHLPKKVVKYVEFNPRLRGVGVLPELMAADLKEILKLKGGNSVK